jgi:hypothetical protein
MPHTALTPQDTQFSFARKLPTSHLENAKTPTTYTHALMDFTNSLTSTTPHHRYYPNPTWTAYHYTARYKDFVRRIPAFFRLIPSTPVPSTAIVASGLRRLRPTVYELLTSLIEG